MVYNKRLQVDLCCYVVDMAFIDALIKGSKALNLSLTENQIDKLLDYINLVQKWNKTHNLTAITSLDDMVRLHLLDSLSISLYIQGDRVIDVGTGAGFPGMVLAIIDPEREYYLLDSLKKRTHFLRHAANKLGVDNVTVVDSRAENYRPLQKFDICVSRAFSSLKQMVEYSFQLVDDNGLFLAMKGIYPADEINALPDNVHLEQVIAIDVPELDAKRHVVLLRKKNG